MWNGPIRREEAPRTSTAIINRLNEIIFNASLLQEFRAIDFVARLIDLGLLNGAHYINVLLHLVTVGAALDQFGAGSKMEADYDFFIELFDIGHNAGKDFLERTF